MELTDRNVINVLSELAPYIEADGGYLEFVEIDYMNEGAFVKVRLGGACSSYGNRKKIAWRVWNVGRSNSSIVKKIKR